MKSFLSITVLLLASNGSIWSDVPKKAPLFTYKELVNNSPFTSKPADIGPADESNPLDDYALIGVSDIGNSGYRVTLIEKKNPAQRITVDSGSTDGRFKILGVTRKDGEPLATSVQMQSGKDTGTIKFDPSLLAPAAAPKAAVTTDQKQNSIPRPRVLKK